MSPAPQGSGGSMHLPTIERRRLRAGGGPSHVPTGKNLVGEKLPTKGHRVCVIPLMGNVKNRQIHRHREWVHGYQGLGDRVTSDSYFLLLG